MSTIGRVGSVAARQHGVVHRRQAFDLGITDEALRWAVLQGALVRLLPEVYAVAGAPATWRQQLMAATLDAGPESAVSHRAAAILLGIAHRDAPEVVELTVPRSFSSRMRGGVVHRSRDLRPEHLLVVDAIPCTGPLRTLIDLGAVERRPVVADAFERALQSGQVTLLGAEWMLTRLGRRGRRGCGVFRHVLDTRALKVASPHPGLLEPRMARLLLGLRTPDYQFKVFDADGGFVAQVDFAYPHLREAFEVDGFQTHGTPDAMTRDFARDHRLRAAGWNVTHFTWHQVVRQPQYVRDVVSALLGAAAVV